MNTDNLPMAYGVPMKSMASAAPQEAIDGRTIVAMSPPRDAKMYRKVAPISPPSLSPARTTALDEILPALQAQGYTRGLVEAMARNAQVFPQRIWVVDNSGSMAMRDGHRIVETGRKHGLRFAPATRWTEMQQAVDYHAQLAALMKAPTLFRMLNDPGRTCGPQQFSVGDGDNIDHDLAVAQSTMANSVPAGVTPLAQHIREIRASIEAMEPVLRRDGAKVAIILATDGVPTSGRGGSDSSTKQEFLDAMRSLENLPVWIVVRLCTDEESVVEYWDELDKNLELSLEVLDDFSSEAAEARQYNGWLNYGLPLHRMREMGFYHRVLDLLDERQLSKDELCDFFRLLFGNASMEGVPDPEGDWKGFFKFISKLVSKEGKTWNPVSKRMEPWVNMRQLKRDYAPSYSFLRRF